MRKIPGTLYQFEITNPHNNSYHLKIEYRSQIVFEKTGLKKEQIIENVVQVFNEKSLVIPHNRIERIINIELNELSIDNDITFIESSVSQMIEEFKDLPSDNMKKIVQERF